MKKIYLSVFLTLVLLSGSVYYLLDDDVKISIEKTRTKYYVNVNDSWTLAATEYVNLFDGTTKMRAKSREITSWNDSEYAYTRRTSTWKDNITTIQTYTFSLTSSDVEQFPLKNEFQCINCEGKIVHYEIRDILYDGETKKIVSPFSFGNRMKIEFQDGYDWAKVYQQKIASDKIVIRYRPQDSDEIYNVRLFDPLWLGTTEGERIWYNSDYPYANQSFRVSEFINVSGDNFTLGGENYRFLGADSYYLSDYATNLTYDDDGNQITNSRQYVEEILNEAQFLNFNVIRTWAGSQGSDDSHWVINESGGHYNLFEVGTPGNYSEEMFQALDWVIYEASKRDIRLQLVFVNNWNDYGGMRWYAQKSPTTNKTYQWVNDSSDDNWWLFHDQFYTDENCRTYYRNYINHTLNRNNTYSGILYKDDPAIFAWLLANEPRAKSDGTGRTKISDWTTNMTAYVKSIDSNHLVGLGIEGWGYVETWGEGTDMIADHNGTGVDFATFALHPDQWAYFAERSEHTGNTGDWVDEGTGSNDFVDWWTNDTNVSFNNRYEGSYVPAYTPALARGNYDNWVTQNVKWANELGMPVLLQEAGYLTSHDKTIKDRFYEQMIHSFYKEGGDGLLFWTLNHDNYYYSTNINGTMDDGYGFYLSDDAFLKNKSQSIIDAINFTKHDNNGGSWITELNSYKYDFVLNVETAGIHNDSVSSDGCVLNLWLEKNATDMSGNGNDGTIYGATNTTGLVGWGMEFDGVDDYITIPNDASFNFSGTDNFTICSWIKSNVVVDTSSSDRWYRIVGKLGSNTGYLLSYETWGGRYIFRLSNGSSIDQANYVTSTSLDWNHLCGNFNYTDMAIYFNGVLVSSESWTMGDIVPQDGDLKIGYSSSLYTWNGTIDEVLIFNRSLSATEIQTIYNNSLKSQPGVATIKNASLYLNTYNGTWSGYILDQNTTALIEDTDYTFTKQFETTDQEAYWYIQSCDDYDLCLNSTVTHIQILSATPVITLSKPANETYFPSGNTVFNYSVTDTLEISNCQLYINDVLNKTDYTITRDTDQSFTTTIPNTLENYTWKVKCTDVGDNVGTSNVRNFYVDPTNPDIEFISPTPDDNSNQSTNSVYVNVSSSDDSPHSVTLDWNRSLKGWWRFNEDTLANDSSSWGNDGTVTGATWTSDGKLGGAYEFDGVNDYIQITGTGTSIDFSGNKSFAFCTWFYPKATMSGSQWLVGPRNWGIRYDGNNRFGYMINYGTTVILSNTYSINEWYYVCGVRDNESYEYLMYIDGDLINNVSASNIDSHDSDIRIGINPVGLWNDLNGSIDDVKIHSRALSPEEIKADYNANLYKYSHNFTDLAEGTYNYTAYAQDFAGNVNETSRSVTFRALGAIEILFKPLATYVNSLWMLAFSLDGASNTPYDASCGTISPSPTDTINTLQNGSYALSWSGQNSHLGNSEKRVFSIFNFPRFFYDTYRVFIRLDTTSNAVTSFNLNLTEVLDRTGIGVGINDSTYRLYRINENGGIYNDTGICYEQPVIVG